MTREEKCQLAISKGIIYNPETGDIIGMKGKVLTNKNKKYIEIKIHYDGNYYSLLGHHLAWYWVNKECVDILDHINGIGDDNRICNLRSVTNQENLFNTKAKGYTWSKRNNKWESQICINYKRISLGYYNTPEEARQAYLNAKEKYHIILK